MTGLSLGMLRAPATDRMDDDEPLFSPAELPTYREQYLTLYDELEGEILSLEDD